MRPFLLACLLAASPALAHDPVIDDCPVNIERACPVEVLLPGLNPLADTPVVTAPDRLTFLALGKPEGTVAVEVSLIDAQILRRVPMRLPGDAVPSNGLVAEGARGFALALWHGGTERGLQFFDAEGQMLGLMKASWLDDWPMELTQSSAVALLAAQNVLTFDGETLRGTVYRFDLRVRAVDGALTVTETRPGTGATDTLGAYLARRLERQIDPVGAEDVHFEGPLVAVTSWASDGSPSRLLLRSEAGGEMAFDQRLGPDRMSFDYMAARVTSDGAKLAAVRVTVGPVPETLLMIFDIATTAPVFEAPLPTGWRPNLVWLDGGRIAVLQDDGDKATRLLVLETR